MSQNPFSNSEIADKYEDWYRTDGLQADHQEKSLLKHLMKIFPDAHSLLEVGCGTGHFTRWFQEEFSPTIFGMDSSAAMLIEASKYAIQGLLKGDAVHVPLAANSADLIAFITTLEFLPDPLSAIREAQRISKQGMLLGVINRHSLLGRKYQAKGGKIWGKAHLFTVQSLQKMVRRVCGRQAEITWETTLWPLFQGHLPLPWGGFIGMAVKWNQ